MNIEQHNARIAIIANAVRKVQRNNMDSEVMPIECYNAADFDDVIECVSFTNDISEGE
mgnify:FL=1